VGVALVEAARVSNEEFLGLWIGAHTVLLIVIVARVVVARIGGV
jgi:hypothetical protein